MDEDRRRNVLRSAMDGTEFKCSEVTRDFFQGEKDGTAFWNVTCFGGQSLAISIDRAGKTKVMDCIDLFSIAKVVCFKAF